MSIQHAHEALEDHLTEAHTEDDAFTVDTAEKADWAVRKIARRRRQLGAAEEVAAAEQTRIAECITDERRRCADDTAFLAGLLEGWHRRLLEDDPKAKTVRLPAGELVARKQPDRVEVDTDVFLLSQEQGSPLVRVKREPDKPEIMRHARQTGEVPAGVTIEQGDVRFTIVTEADR